MSDTKPRVSVLMPAYNAEKYIAKAIESILNQTFADFEFLIIDDGSTDGTWDCIRNFAEKDKRIITSKHKKNLKICATRNELISLSRGEYIVWQDADDISLPQRIEKQVSLMDGNPAIGISGGYLSFFNESGNLSTRKYAANDVDLRKTVFRYSPVAQPAAILRRSLLEKAGHFDESLTQAEDLDLSLRLGAISKFSNLQEIILMYRVNGNSITMRALQDNIRQTLTVRKRAAGNYGYKMKLMDKIVFNATAIFQFMPAQITYLIFNLLRNSRN